MDTFLGSPLRVAATVIGSLVAVVALAVLFGVLGVPGVGAVQNSFGPVNATTTTIETDLVVTNPNPIGVSLGGVTINYTVAMNDVRMAAGQKDGVSVESGNSTLSFTTAMRNDRIPPWWVSHIANGERTNVTIDASVRSATLGGRAVTVPQERQISTDIVSQFNSETTRPIDADQPVVRDPVLYVNETSAEWDTENLTAERTPIDMSFLVYNPKPWPYAVSEVGYTITMNDVTVGEGSSEDVATVTPGDTERLRTRTAIRNQNLDEWWVSHLERNQVTDLRIDFYLVVDPQTAALTDETSIRIPLDALEYRRTIETDVFGTKNGSADTASSTAASADSGTDTRTEGGESASTPRDDSASTPTDSTPTETTTTRADDGGLLG
jgi:LEA14-like dessication related protein